MNLREGTRRLALLLGVVGTIFGGFASYMELQTVQNQRARHNRFEQLTNSPVVKQARKSCFENSAMPDKRPSVEFDRDGKLIPPYCLIPINDERATDYAPSELNSGGIKTVHFQNREIASIEPQDGQTLYPTPAPATWLYLLIALFPVLGFLIPWGVVRSVGWVGAGFVQPAK
jgi:hypothetical protein